MSGVTGSKVLRTCLPIVFFLLFAPLAMAEQQAVIRMLVPGFTVQELPVRLTNVNSLRFSPDGTLYALGYDGRIHKLRDTDGDGLEDHAEPYWDQPTLRVPVGMAFGPKGLYVSSHDKVSLLRDTDGDGRADQETVLASGWPPTDVAAGGVDAIGVTLGPDGKVYFGLIVADYSNAYRVKDGQSHYDLAGPRGTVQVMAPDGTGRQTVCTGIRVPYALAFNKAGDLFLTDQEGETWLPGGNPLDELNYIIPGRHYGFPPRSDKYLPNVIDEPPVVAFGPQHQSTCGLVFNEPTPPTKGLFGPASWEGNALIAGLSRGKIWRVTLAKTPAGYVGRETIIARSTMLVSDVAISPRGDLYVSCHSGQPDWGTGPTGEGKLFKITYTGAANTPQPVAVWPAGPDQVSIAFDRPLDHVPDFSTTPGTIEYGPYVRAADRFEVLRPGYKTVKIQQATPRRSLAVQSTTLSADRRTLLVRTAAHPEPTHYALTIPDPGSTDGRELDLAYDLSGTAAHWSGQPSANSDDAPLWLPHLDTDISRAFLAGSSQGERLAKLLTEPGLLKLDTLLTVPDAPTALHLEATTPFEADADGQHQTSSVSANGLYTLQLPLPGGQGRRHLSISLPTGGSAHPASLHVAFSTARDATIRPLPFDRLLIPWAPAESPAPPPATPHVETASGDFERGRALFTTQLKCATCHQTSRDLAPVLNNLAHRDPAAILRDITQPSATINPDYVTYRLKLRDGHRLEGFVRDAGTDAVRLVSVDQDQTIPRDQIAEMTPRPISAMPEGLLTGLNDSQIADLLAFLTVDPEHPTTHPATRPTPPTRTPAQISTVLRANPPLHATQTPRLLRITLIDGKQDHGPGEHDYPAWQSTWQNLLSKADAVTLSTAFDWPTPEQFAHADVLMFYFWNHDWNKDRYAQLDAFLARGGGVVVLHSACIEDQNPEALADRFGLAAHPKRTHYRHGPFQLHFAAPSDNPITRGFTTLPFVDEPYWPMIGDETRVTVLATDDEEGKPRPLVWTFEPARGGRVFGSILGHYTSTLDDPLYRILVLRGTAWAVHEDERRFESLATDNSSPKK